MLKLKLSKNTREVIVMLAFTTTQLLQIKSNYYLIAYNYNVWEHENGNKGQII